eukprot:scaffold56598_cov33-Prasinocladus_malaysianus.AAC.1
MTSPALTLCLTVLSWGVRAWGQKAGRHCLAEQIARIALNVHSVNKMQAGEDLNRTANAKPSPCDQTAKNPKTLNKDSQQARSIPQAGFDIGSLCVANGASCVTSNALTPLTTQSVFDYEARIALILFTERQ